MLESAYEDFKQFIDEENFKDARVIVDNVNDLGFRLESAFMFRQLIAAEKRVTDEEFESYSQENNPILGVEVLIPTIRSREEIERDIIGF